VPYPHYGETVDGVADEIRHWGRAVADGIDREALRRTMPAGAARNVLDCALWDLEAKRFGTRAAAVARVAPLHPVDTAWTLSLDTPEIMAEAARATAHRPLLKVKLGGANDPARLVAIRAAAPWARLIVDANESWSPENFAENMAAAFAAGAELVEQPLPAGKDELLANLPHTIPICADESAHVTADIPSLVGLYDAVNIKLDKAGGLTEALDFARTARAAGLTIMVGCMVATSLAMAPAFLLAQQADFVDLDGPLLLARDREPGLRYEGSRIYPPEAELWG